MGTSGTGRLSDYGIKEEVDICDKVIENILLENCGDYDYLKNKSIKLEIGSRIKLKDETRMVIYNLDLTISIGALSTNYEKIRHCFKKGYEFDGEITNINNDNGLTNIYVTLIGTKEKK